MSAAVYPSLKDKLVVNLLIATGDETLVRGLPETGRFAVFHLRDNAVAAVEAVNSPQDFMAGKLLIAAGRPVDRSLLADPAVPMKTIISATTTRAA